MKKYMLIVLLAGIAYSGSTQDKSETSAKALIESKSFVFKAESVSPPRGRFTHLTSNYDLIVAGDSVTAFLPYFGRAFSAPITPSEGGIKFTSVNNEYETAKRKKDGWEIVIRPKDGNDVQALYLTVFDNKRASLRVNSVNRESISFNGYIREREGGTKKPF